MDLREKATHQTNDRKLNLDERVRLRCQQAQELKEKGDYEGARRAMSEVWERVGERPQLEGLDQETRAEVLLCAGTLSGWIGSAQQINGAQEFAKDLIGESATLFDALGRQDKVAEAYVDLAICYWREGALAEARVWFREALSRLSDEHREQKARTLLNSTLVEVSSNRYHDALALLNEAAPLFEVSDNHAAKGRFHLQFALVFKKLGEAEHREDYMDRALVEYAAASFHLEQAGHTRYLARVENNLGSLLLALGRYHEAHEHLDRARRIFIALSDSGSVAQVNETRARALIAQGRYAEAERIAFGAVHTLEQGGEQSLLAEALTTQGIALARMGYDEQALRVLRRAGEVTQQAGDLEAAGRAYIAIIKELKHKLSARELLDAYGIADHLLANSQHAETLSRLRECARIAISAAAGQTGQINLDDFLVGGSLEEEVLRYEGELIRRALDEAGSSVTRAARLLGVSHQALSYMLNTRHRNLLPARTPAKPRRRSLMTKSRR